MKVYIMIGPPCSGKTTLAKEMMKYDKNIIRVNRDELRSMLAGKYITGDFFIEGTINNMTTQFIQLACAGRKDIIIDATHCRVSYINSIKRAIPETCNVTIKYILCDEPLWRLKIRNVWRWLNGGIWIPKKVMENMYHNFKIIQEKINNNEI